MANFFKEYGANTYKKKNAGKPVEDLTKSTSALTGHSAPDPSTLKDGHKPTRDEREKEQDE